MKIIWILITLAILASTAGAAPLDDKIKSFSDALKASNAAKSATDPMASERTAGMMSQFATYIGMPGGEGNIEALVRQMMATNTDAAVQTAGKALLDELSAQRKSRADALTAQLNAVLTRASDVLLKAQKTQELDVILNDLQKLQPGRGAIYGNDQDAQLVMNQVNQAYQFVAQWQDYLSNRNSGNTQEALNSLRNLLNSRQSGQEMLVPRSEVLSRIDQLGVPKNGMPMPPPSPNLDSIFNGIKALDDIKPALSALQLVANQSVDFNQLNQMAMVYADAKSGLPVSLDVYSPQYGPNTPTNAGISRVRAMVLLYLLPQFIGDGALTPNADEPVADYLKRSMNTAVTKQDWGMLQKIIEAQLKVSKTQNVPGGTRAFLTGLSQDMTGQYALAVGSYQAAIRDADDFVPLKVAGDRLAAIKKDHPEEYEDGMKRFLNPPASNYMNPYLMNPYLVRPGMPGYPTPGVPTTNPTPATPVPVLSTNAAPAMPAPPAANTNAVQAPAPPAAPEKK